MSLVAGRLLTKRAFRLETFVLELKRDEGFPFVVNLTLDEILHPKRTNEPYAIV